MRPVPLTGGLRRAAEAFFGTELGGVEIRRGPEARELGAAGFAAGDRICLADDLQLAPWEALELVGHELTHVVQQRQGRVAAAGALGGRAFNDDPELEREAAENGRRFARGETAVAPRLPVAAGRAPVIQRAVTVGNHPLTGPNDLSPSAAAVLGLIDNGPDWLDWAVKTPAINYRFAAERDLILGTQTGLHGAELMLLRGLSLLTHPFRLLEMQPDDLRVVAAAESDTDANSVTQNQARKILAKQQLLTQAELAIGPEFLTQAGVSALPVFQEMNLSDQIALFEMVDGATSEISLNPIIQKEAAAFATLHAQTPKEFVDYYQFYVASVDEPSPQAKGAASRGRKAEVSLEALSTLLYGMLFCPAVQGVPTPEQMNAIIQNWVSAGNRLGFPRLSRAVSQVGQNADLKGATGDAAAQAINAYIDQAQNFLLQRPANAVALTQDGGERRYVYDTKQVSAQVSLEANGNVTLAVYQVRQ